jgi:uroporphyrinogen III methyltransferase/synthase
MDSNSSSERRGIVYLVGAGPGDPGLITVKGRRLLEQADAVVYDALSDPRLLSHCRDDAEKIYVGKRAAAHHFTQEQINALLVKLGGEGKRVVRSRAATPSSSARRGRVRGAEECGIAFEVVPASPARSPRRATQASPSPIATSTPASPSSPDTRRKENTALQSPKPAALPRDRRTSIGPRSPNSLHRVLHGVKSLPRICSA